MQSSSLRFFYGLVLLGVLVPQIVLGLWALDSRAVLRDEARQRALGASANIAEHSGRVFDSYVLASDLFATLLQSWTRDFAARHGREYMLRLLSHADGMPSLGVALFDRNGDLLASTEQLRPVNRSDRAYLRRALESEGPVLTGAIRGRASQMMLFSLSRKVVLGDGTVGVVVFFLRSHYFESLVASLSGQQGGFVTSLYLMDGQPLVRHPSPSEPIILEPTLPAFGARTTGTFEKPSAVDGTRRIYGFTQLSRYGAVAVVGLDEAGIYAAWWARFQTWALLAAAFSLGLGSLFWAALSRVRVMRRQAETLSHEVALRTAEAEERAQAAEQAMRRAERADQAKSQFLASASHDLRQPLQALRFYLDLGFASKSDPAALPRVIEMANQALNGAEDLLRGLTEISSLEAGIVKPQIRAWNLQAVLAPLHQEMKGVAQAAGLRLRWRVPAAWVLTDAELLKRIVCHLVANAIRYTEHGDVLVGCRRPGGQVRIDVIDTGIGIAPQHHEQIFEDFFQLGNDSRDRNKGLGLGLAIVQRSAAILGHRTELRSAPGAGSRFSVFVEPASGAQIDEALAERAAKADKRVPA